MDSTFQFHDRLEYNSSRPDGDYDYDLAKSYREFKDYFTENPFDNIYFVIYFKCGINFFCVFGIFFNSVFIMVLTRHGFKDTTNILLGAIAADDIILFTVRIYSLVVQITNGIFQITNVEVAEFFDKVISPWTTICVTSSLCLVAVMAVERLVAVSFPFLVSRVFTPFRIKCALVLIHFFVTITVYLNNESYFQQYMYHEYSSFAALATNNSYLSLSKTFIPLISWFDPVLLVLFPVIVILLCYIAILLKLQLAAQKLTRLSSGISHSSRVNLKRNKLNKMLFVLMTVTLLSFLTPPTFQLYKILALNVYKSLDLNLTNVYLMLSQVCQIVFSSANSIVCVMMSSSFATTFKKIVCRA